jgi:hypothetical protein
MVHGRAGMKLEAYKFGLYLIIPITASFAFNEPTVQRWAADYFQFLKYPANPNTNLKEEFEELLKKRELEKEQMKAYAEQVQKLQESAQQSRIAAAAAKEAEGKRAGWFSWMRLRRGKEALKEEANQ